MISKAVLVFDEPQLAPHALKTMLGVIGRHCASIYIIAVSHPLNVETGNVETKEHAALNLLGASLCRECVKEGISADFTVLAAPVHHLDEIDSIAKRCHADIIVAAHRRTGWFGCIMKGSLAKRLINIVHCPLLIVGLR